MKIRLFPFEDIIAMGFPKPVTDALALMTHDMTVPYMDYVAKIKTNPIAKAVKLADLRHNSDTGRLEYVDEKVLRRIRKYHDAIELLEE